MLRPPSFRPSTVSTTCPECSLPYRSADSPHIPLILSCHHLCCEDCIRTAFCNDSQIICRECGKPSTPNASSDVKLSNLRESFPVSEKMIEEINKMTQMKPVDESSITFLKAPKKRNVETSSNTSLHEEACQECSEAIAYFKCLDCNGALFCEECWHRAHQHSNVFKKHKKQQLALTSSSPMENPKPEFAKLLKEAREKLLKKQEKVERSLKILSNQDIIEEVKSSGIDTTKVGSALKEYFVYCQNAIKSVEIKIMKEFNAVACSLEISHAKCCKELHHLHAEIVELNQELYKKSGEEFFDPSVVEKLIAKSNDLLDKPDVVHTRRPTGGSEKFEKPSDEWFQQWKSLLHVDFGQAGQFSLHRNNLDSDELDSCDAAAAPLCAGDIGDSFEKTSHSSLTFGDRLGHRSRQRRSSMSSDQLRSYSSGENSYTNRHKGSLTDTECGPHRTQDVRGKPSGPYDPKTSGERANFGRHVRFREGWRGPVVVSSIESPSIFFVQLEPALETLKKYRKFFSRASSVPPIDHRDLKIGSMYLAQCSDKEWYRVRFTNCDLNDPTILVNLIDIGSKEIVDITKLRRIDDIMKSAAMDPEIAIQCCIYDCHPVGSSWAEEDIANFSKMLMDRKVTMVVKNVRSNKLDVDLEWNENGNQVLVRDFMLMSRRACISLRKDNQNYTIGSTKYFKDTFKSKECHDVRLSYVCGPDEIYVKRNDVLSERKIEKMNAQIDEFYKDSFNYRACYLATPAFGLPVAAQFSADNTWYRAEIISVNPSKKKAEVRYVDFGNKEWLPYSRIRLLEREFILFTTRAIRCSLAGIFPLNGKKYDPLASNIVINACEDKLLKLVVDDIIQDEVSVILYKCTENEDVCINTLLIEEQYARQCGDVLGRHSVYPRKRETEISTPKIVVEKEISEINTPKIPEKEIPAIVNVAATEEPEVENNDIASDGDDKKSESESDISSVENVLQEDNPDESSNQKPRLEVKMISFKNPNLFYVALTNYLPTVQTLVDDVTKFYRDEKNCSQYPMKSIEKGVKCVAYSTNDQKWYRAKINEVRENNEVNVFFTDVAREEMVKSQNLRAVEKQFEEQYDGTIACHMLNVEERSEWPVQLCEALMNSLEKFDSIYIIKFKMAKEKGKVTYPVELWGKQVVCKGAFAANTEEWTNFNKLVSKALENDGLLELESVSEVELNSKPKEELIETLDGKVDQIDSTETVEKWLNDNLKKTTPQSIQCQGIVRDVEFHCKNLSASITSTKSSAVTIEKTSEVGPTRSWKPAEPLDDEELNVWTTYLGDNFVVYAQKVEKIKILEMISHGLQNKFEGTTALPSDLHWYPGLMCIAWYFLDKKWYRGKVIEVKEKVLVEYVDYGNIEWVEPIHLRKDVALEHFPIQCHQFSVRSDLVPTSKDGKWPEKILDFVHSILLEKKCKFKLRKEEGEDFCRLEKIILEDTGVELFDYLCQLGYATIVSSSPIKRSKTDKSNKSENVAVDSNENIGDDDEDNRSDSSSEIAPIDSASNIDPNEMPGVSNMMNGPFSIPQNPQGREIVVPSFRVPVDELNTVTVQVIEILQMDQIVVHIVDSENKTVNENRKLFEKMNAELQNKGGEQPKLTSPSLGRICCTEFVDNRWYRAKIINICTDDDSVSILYVDYGNTSPVNPAELREMKRSWFDVPMQAIRCRLIDFEEFTGDEKLDVDEMVKLIMNKKFEAHIEDDDDENWYKIKLYSNVID